MHSGKTPGEEQIEQVVKNSKVQNTMNIMLQSMIQM